MFTDPLADLRAVVTAPRPPAPEAGGSAAYDEWGRLIDEVEPAPEAPTGTAPAGPAPTPLTAGHGRDATTVGRPAGDGAQPHDCWLYTAPAGAPVDRSPLPESGFTPSPLGAPFPTSPAATPAPANWAFERTRPPVEAGSLVAWRHDGRLQHGICTGTRHGGREVWVRPLDRLASAFPKPAADVVPLVGATDLDRLIGIAAAAAAARGDLTSEVAG